MALYLIGDIQGCDAALHRLLQTLDFSPSRDTLFALGDLVNRGPASDRVLRRLMGFGNSAQCVLGNHDLHLLAVAHGVRAPSRKDTLACVLDALDRQAMLQWLQQQPLALMQTLFGRDVLMVHAGVLPQWTAQQTVALAAEVQDALRGAQAADFFANMYGDAPQQWHDTLRGQERLRVVVNALTRLRFCSDNGSMEFASKDSAHSAPAGYFAWFDIPHRRSRTTAIAFGHWSTLGWLDRDDLWALDSGCVWGGSLTALRISQGQHTAWQTERIQVPCPQAQKPDAPNRPLAPI